MDTPPLSIFTLTLGTFLNGHLCSKSSDRHKICGGRWFGLKFRADKSVKETLQKQWKLAEADYYIYTVPDSLSPLLTTGFILHVTKFMQISSRLPETKPRETHDFQHFKTYFTIPCFNALFFFTFIFILTPPWKPILAYSSKYCRLFTLDVKALAVLPFHCKRPR